MISFSKDLEKEVPTALPVRELPAYSFYRRFTRNQRKLIRKSNEDDVIDVMANIKQSVIVRLDHPYFIADMDILENNGLITVDEREILTADVIPEEL